MCLLESHKPFGVQGLKTVEPQVNILVCWLSALASFGENLPAQYMSFLKRHFIRSFAAHAHCQSVLYIHSFTLYGRRKCRDRIALPLYSAGHEWYTCHRYVPHPSCRLLQADRSAVGQLACHSPGHLPDVQPSTRPSQRARRQRQRTARKDEGDVWQGRRVPADDWSDYFISPTYCSWQ